MGTTNILDLNNRLTKVEKGNVAQNSYTSLKNKPKINNVTLTGNKTLADIGAAAAADVGDKTQLNTTNKSSTVAAINELVEKKIGIYNNPGFHNSIYRGASLGTEVTTDQWDAISAGTFDDLFIGDYWTINGTVYRIAAFDYWLHSGDTECTAHHVVVVPDENLYTVYMNDSNITTGGYIGSKMYTDNLTTAKTTIKGDFGSAHILSHREYLTNEVTSGRASAGAWVDSDIELMNESMVYGKHFEPVSDGSNVPCAYTVDTSQLPLFALEHSRIYNRAHWWLRDVVSETDFAFVDRSGTCSCYDAAGVLGVRPVFGICK